MKVRLWETEWYPVLVVDREIKEWQVPTEVPEELVVQWEEADKALSKAIGDLYPYYQKSLGNRVFIQATADNS